ncbi:unnamed protein product [Dracunculus medinensis]|uniref:Glutamate receptor n=1 Tax=Dracunculus medinensis TaxID=318479 RepID=A0A3P7QG06_DRAME|nr:unnamed protein product [Dracunculus medinensis]
MDNSTTTAILDVLRLAEFSFNSRPQNTFDIILGIRQLPPMNANSLVWHLADFVCEELKLGFMVLITGTSPISFGLYNSISKMLKVPLIDWEVSDKDDNEETFSLSIRPPTNELLTDYIIFKQWHKIVFFHDGISAKRSFSSIYEHFKAKDPDYRIYIDAYQIPEEEEYFREFLNIFHRQAAIDTQKGKAKINKFRPMNIIVDIHNNYRMHSFLKALEETIIVKKHYNYVFANFDMNESELELLQYSLINITIFRLEVIRQYGRSIFTNLFKHHQLYNKGYPGLYCRPEDDKDHPNRPFEAFEFGEILFYALKKVIIVLDEKDGTLSGRIQFDADKLVRTNFTATVIEIKQGQRTFNTFRENLEWTQGIGFHGASKSIQSHDKSRNKFLEGRRKSVLRIVTVLVKPFVMLKRSISGEPPKQGNDRFDGYCIDLLKLLSKNLSDFQYEIFISDGNKYGARQDDGSWDGMIGYLLNETADIAVAPLTINQERERVVDFSKPFMTTGISIMIKKPEKQEFSVFSFMQPLSMRIWIFILCSYIGVSTTIFVVSWFSPYENGFLDSTRQMTFYNTLWFTLAAFMQQGTDILPRSFSGRVASSAWWFFTLIIVSSYTANLAAFLTLEKMTPPIESVDDLAAQKKILYGIVKGGSTEAFFKDSAVPIYKKMWNFMHNTYLQQLLQQQNSINNTDTIMVNTYAEGIDKVRRSKGRYAFLLEETANEYENTRKPCDTMKVGTNLNTLGYGVATKIGNPLRRGLNLAILYLHEKGELKRLENKWWYDRGQCDQGITEGGTSSSLTLSKVAGIFYILCCGMVISMASALAEYLYRLKNERLYEKASKVNELLKLKQNLIY